MTNFEKVRNFHMMFRRPARSKPTSLPPRDKLLRISLIGEEYREYVQAATIEEQAKELADLLYVVYGTAVEMGIDLDKVFAAVHESNMTKLDENGKPILREDGKVLKGVNYREPDIASALGMAHSKAL